MRYVPVRTDMSGINFYRFFVVVGCLFVVEQLKVTNSQVIVG